MGGKEFSDRGSEERNVSKEKGLNRFLTTIKTTPIRFDSKSAKFPPPSSVKKRERKKGRLTEPPTPNASIRKRSIPTSPNSPIVGHN